MGAMIGVLNRGQDLFDRLRGTVDFAAPVMLRIYLVPVFFVAGSNKWDPFAAGGTLNPAEGLRDVAAWFGNPDWGLGLPAPMLMAFLAWAAEYAGALCLALGLAVRWVCIPLLVTMVVATTTVHWENGWQAVHDPRSPYATETTAEALERLDRARSILSQHGDYEWLTEHGAIVSSNNGFEWPATYFVMLSALLVLGGGRYFSVDYWLARHFRRSAPDPHTAIGRSPAPGI